MKIPNSFKIGGGKKVKVDTFESIPNREDVFGDYSCVRSQIRLGKSILDGEGNKVDVSEEDLERTFWHETFHAFQWFYNTEYDETQAQCFSNFMYELMHSLDYAEEERICSNTEKKN